MRLRIDLPRVVRGIGCFAAGVGWSGCTHTRAPLPPAGTSAHRFVEPAGEAMAAAISPAEQRSPLVAIMPARPLEPLTQPVYPEVARGRQPMPTTVRVRLMIDASGGVAEVQTSALTLSAGGTFTTEFQEAVVCAVRQWRFEPAERRLMTPGTGTGGAYWHVTRLETCPYEVDVLFTFTAAGVVTAGAR